VAYTSWIAEPVKKDYKLITRTNLRITRFVLRDSVVLDVVTESAKVGGLHTEERSKFATVLALDNRV